MSMNINMKRTSSCPPDGSVTDSSSGVRCNIYYLLNHKYTRFWWKCVWFVRAKTCRHSECRGWFLVVSQKTRPQTFCDILGKIFLRKVLREILGCSL